VGLQKYGEGGPFQAMAPPVIRNGDLLLSQSIVCMTYLAEKLGVCPKNIDDRFRAEMIANNCNDLMGEMYGYREKTKKELFQFINGRFQIWLDLLEKPLKRNNSKYYFGGKCCFADLALFNIMDGIEELFGADSFNKYVVSTHEYLVGVYKNLKERESIKRLMTKQDGLYTFAPSFGWKNVRKYFRENNENINSFKSDEIIPDVVDSEPLELLTMKYGENIKLTEMGQILTPYQVRQFPETLEFKGCDNKKLYTIILTDPDARDRKKHEFREWVHFVRVNVNGNDLAKSGQTVIEYVGSGPPKDSGLHRYVWLVYEQRNNQNIEVAKCGQKKLISGGGNGEGRRQWKARKFVKDNNLGPLVAGTYYNAEYDDFVPKLYAWLQGKGSLEDK